MDGTFGATAANAVYSICVYLTIFKWSVVSYPPSALIFCKGWKMLLQQSNHILGTARPQLLSLRPINFI